MNMNRTELDSHEDGGTGNRGCMVASRSNHRALRLLTESTDPASSDRTSEQAPDTLSHPTTPSHSDHFPSRDEWQITFEQFLGGIQQEPELCQFFAEKYQMDLFDRSGGGLALSSYTKTFMTK